MSRMKKQTNNLKLTVLAASVAVLSVGCASTGYARYDDDRNAMGASAGAEVGGAEAGVSAGVDIDDDPGLDRDYNYDTDYDQTDMADAALEGSSRSTVSALSFSPETRPTWVNKFPFYDWNLAVVETYTFAVPDPDLTLTAGTDAPAFRADMEPGSVFVEAAGGAGEITAGRVIRHSPTPIR